ncbi:hypothetical protein [Planctomyces sp. SH-PL62]|uniref:hypothetical protein n=1 Tax=Planctomyces sp. SH-PL62 TaxID=1636152 RepID=UPI00078E84C3|nr:hypothetical protein [Planctomyces sp. SH-PL62]AMV35834.1 hypothetical protein VT85_00220 [Planctomyces sp. SH-PL62]
MRLDLIRTACRMTTLAAALLPLGCGDLEAYPGPEYAFQATFGAFPSSSVRNLQGEGRAFRDSGHVYLKFEVPQGTLQAMLGGGFTPLSAEAFAKETTGAAIYGPRPGWWMPLPGSTVLLESKRFHPTFSTGEAFAAYEPATSTAYLYWSGMD